MFQVAPSSLSTFGMQLIKSISAMINYSSLFLSLPLCIVFESNRMPSNHFAWPETRSETAAKPAAVNRFFFSFFLDFFFCGWTNSQRVGESESWTESDSATIVNEIRQIDL